MKKAKDIVKNRGVPLGFSIWPDIKIENWDQYYLFYDGNAQVNILPKNVFAVKDIRNKRYFSKPSEVKREKAKERSKVIKKLQKANDEMLGYKMVKGVKVKKI